MSKILVIEDDNIIQKFLSEIEDEKIVIIDKQDSLKKTNILHYKNVVINIENYEVFIDKRKIYLTAREFEILKIFMQNQGKVFSREKILDLVWGYDYYGDSNIVNTHIKNIRQKIGNEYITTVRGIGYKI